MNLDLSRNIEVVVVAFAYFVLFYSTDSQIDP